MKNRIVAASVAGLALTGGIGAAYTSSASASPQPVASATPATSTASTPAAQPVTNDLVWLAHTKSVVNLRSAPSTHGRILAVIPQGYWVYMPKTQSYGNHEDVHHWITVVVNGQTGYMNAGYVSTKWLSNEWSGSRPEKVAAADEKRMRAMGL